MGTQSVRRNTSQTKPACSKVYPDSSTDIPYDWEETYDTGEGCELLIDKSLGCRSDSLVM